MVSNNVMVALFREELDREAADIADRVSTALLTPRRAHATQDRSLFANAIQEFRTGEARNVVGHFELAPCTRRVGMDNPVRTLGNRHAGISKVGR